MSTQVKIELTEQAQKIVVNLQTLPPRILNAIAGAMNEAAEVALTNVQQKHLTGTGPFPPSEHRLGVRSGFLREHASRNDATVSGNTVDSSIGDNMIYAALHEFGGRVHHNARDTKVRLRTDARGNLMRQAAHAHLAIFAKSSHKRAVERDAHIGAHDVDMPERAPFRTGIRESMPVYKQSISAGIVAAWANLKN